MQHHGWCCSCHRCAVRGATGTVVMPCVVLWALSLCCTRCRRCCCCAVHGATGAVVTPRVVLWVLSSHHAWCCGHCCHTACGATGAVVVPHGCCSCHCLATHDVVRTVVTAKTGHQLGGLVKRDGERDVPTEGAREAEP
jgi:hypothetical protein